MRDDPARDPAPEIALQRRIGVVARRMNLRRQRIATDADRLRRTLHDRLRSRGALLTAIGVGVALEQSRRRRPWSLAGVLNVINAGLALKASIEQHRHPAAPRDAERSVR